MSTHNSKRGDLPCKTRFFNYVRNNGLRIIHSSILFVHLKNIGRGGGWMSSPFSHTIWHPGRKHNLEPIRSGLLFENVGRPPTLLPGPPNGFVPVQGCKKRDRGSFPSNKLPNKRNAPRLRRTPPLCGSMSFVSWWSLPLL